MNFSDEVTSSMRISDGVVLFIDAAEGVSHNVVVSLHIKECHLQLTPFDIDLFLSLRRWCWTRSVWSNMLFRSAWRSPSASTRWTGSSWSSNFLPRMLITNFGTLWMKSTVCSGNLLQGGEAEGFRVISAD